jgi:hypothetical protein
VHETVEKAARSVDFFYSFEASDIESRVRGETQ